MAFRDYQPSVAPPWLQGSNGRAWLEEFGGSKDSIVADLKAAVKCRFPELAPADALSLIGLERQIDRGPLDSDQVYAQRLLDAWVTWSRGGMPVGLLLALEVAGYTGIALVQQAKHYFTLNPDTTLDAFDRIQIGTYPGNPSGWGFDLNWGLPPEEGLWHRFGVVFPNAAIPAGWTNILNPPTDVSAPTRAEVNNIRRIIRLWKPAKAYCYGIYVQVAGAMWGWPPAQTWGAMGLVWGGSGVIWAPDEN